MSEQLRLLYTSNAPWAASGYGVQGKSLLPRLAQLPELGGRENIGIFAWYGLQGGMHNVGGFAVYPAGNDPYGNDIIGQHTKHFGANIIVSLIDVWVMQRTAAKVKPALWCVPGDTLITLNDGLQRPIKDLYEMQPNRHAMIGHDGSRQVKGLITGYHYMGVKPTLEIETVTGRKLRTTAESGVYVNRNGDAKYIPASSVTSGDMVYCTAGNHTFIQENHNDELGAGTHDGLAISIGYSGDRTGVPGGDYRRRGRDQHPRPHETTPHEGAYGRTVSDTAISGADLQHGTDVDRMAARQDWLQGKWSRPPQGPYELSGRRVGLSHVRDTDALVAILDRQETSSSVAYGIHGDSRGAVGYGTQPTVRTARSANLADAPRTELEEVRSVRSTGILEPVYDLTTSTHNFYANGILIHNCPWLPIDHDPVPQRVLDCLEGAHLPLTYAKWGRDMLTQAGVKNHYIPHGIEPTVYRVNADREAALAFKRGLTGKEDCFLCVMVAANKGFPDRKWFQGQLRAFQGLRKEHPDAMLYIHSEPTPVYGGLEFGALIHHLGLAGSVIFPDRYDNFMGMPPQHLADIYNAADVLLGASMSEGFGIPLIEAQACGTPVVTTNFSAMPELVRWGYAVDVMDYVWTPMNAYQAWPSVTDMTDKLNRLYEQWDMAGRDWPMAKRLETQNAIHAEYDWDMIVRDQWAPLITKLAEAAPPLDGRFQSPGVSVGDETQDFVDVLNEELAKDAAIASHPTDAKPPKRRVAPLTPVRVNSDGVEVAA